MQNLTVDPEDLKKFATHQKRVSEYLETGGKASEKLGWNTWWSHGPICASFNGAVVTAEPARLAAATAMKKVSEVLNDNLLETAKKYSGTDDAGGQQLDQQVLDK